MIEGGREIRREREREIYRKIEKDSERGRKKEGSIHLYVYITLNIPWLANTNYGVHKTVHIGWTRGHESPKCLIKECCGLMDRFGQFLLLSHSLKGEGNL